jgi:hypothetical protein
LRSVGRFDAPGTSVRGPGDVFPGREVAVAVFGDPVVVTAIGGVALDAASDGAPAASSARVPSNTCFAVVVSADNEACVLDAAGCVVSAGGGLDAAGCVVSAGSGNKAAGLTGPPARATTSRVRYAKTPAANMVTEMRSARRRRPLGSTKTGLSSGAFELVVLFTGAGAAGTQNINPVEDAIGSHITAIVARRDRRRGRRVRMTTSTNTAPA